MTTYEIVAVALSAIGLLISIISLIKSSKANDISKKANEISKEANIFSKDANRLSEGQVELTIHQLISQAKKDISEISIAIADNSDATQRKKLMNNLMNDALEREINAYEEACAKYLDGKVDKERFKRNYCLEIRQLVGNETLHNKFFDAVSSPFKCILKVYKEWNDMENS